MKKFKKYVGYAIKRDGSIWSCWSAGRKAALTKRWHELKQRQYPNKYKYVSFKENGKWRNFMVHRLLAQTFIPNPAALPFVCHVNDNRQDNRLTNLKWGTRDDNTKDAIRNKKFLIGELMPTSKLTVGEVRIIKQLLKLSKAKRLIAKRFNVSPATIYAIAKGYNWRSITI